MRMDGKRERGREGGIKAGIRQSMGWGHQRDEIPRKKLWKARADDAQALLEMHDSRKEVLRDAVGKGERFAIRNGPDQFGPHLYSCNSCQYPIVEGVNEGLTAVEVFRSRVSDYINRCPEAQDLCKPEFWERKIGGIAILKCRNCDSDIFRFDTFAETIEICNAYGELPSEVW